MVTSGTETIIGVTRDPVFGPVVMFGLGGVFVEVLREVVMHPAPFDERTADALVRGARFAPMLTGARGRKACDIAAVAALLARLSALAARSPSLATVDLNPVLALPDGAIVLDFKLETEPATHTANATNHTRGAAP
jgi:hypothetical protein